MGYLGARDTLLDDGGQPIKEGWYSSRVDPSNPWQATDAAHQRGG
jgi:hypothetical protein